MIAEKKMFRQVQTESDCQKANKPCPKQQILDSSKLKEFADDNFKFDKKWWKVL